VAFGALGRVVDVLWAHAAVLIQPLGGEVDGGRLFYDKCSKNFLNVQCVFVVSAESGCASLAALHKTFSRLRNLPLISQEHGQRRKA
jgi:hypothetical protein